ncbi:MAG TPA: FkbM family methyltransferase, partial [Cytophagales bacterium]|nr:FkbM family methyltransferase [Cytophagales bacterium]
LVHTHAGTASAIGKDVSAAYPLDSVILNKYSDQGIDFIKVDIDGYDGKAIKGAQQVLRIHHPVVIFEWHPILTQKAKNDLYEAFNVLTETEYTDFVFFNKYGTFSHFISGVDDALRALAEVCLHNQHHDDWHYDVVAIPYGKIDKIALAECQYAKRKISMY